MCQRHRSHSTCTCTRQHVLNMYLWTWFLVLPAAGQVVTYGYSRRVFAVTASSTYKSWRLSVGAGRCQGCAPATFSVKLHLRIGSCVVSHLKKSVAASCRVMSRDLHRSIHELDEPLCSRGIFLHKGWFLAGVLPRSPKCTFCSSSVATLWLRTAAAVQKPSHCGTWYKNRCVVMK